MPLAPPVISTVLPESLIEIASWGTSQRNPALRPGDAGAIPNRRTVVLTVCVLVSSIDNLTKYVKNKNSGCQERRQGHSSGAGGVSAVRLQACHHGGHRRGSTHVPSRSVSRFPVQGRNPHGRCLACVRRHARRNSPGHQSRRHSGRKAWVRLRHLVRASVRNLPTVAGRKGSL